MNGASKGVLTSDANGVASWSTLTGTTQWTTSASDIYFNTGKVGIGTSSPGAQLEVDPASTSDIGLKVWGLNGQTAHLQSWGIPSNGTMAYVGANGTIYSSNSVWGNGIHSTDAGGYSGVSVDGQNRAVTFSVPGSSTMDSRIYRSAASVLTVDNSSGGSANLAVTGKIGIGTSSPGYPLDVQGSWPNQITIGATGAAGSIGLRRGSEGAITGTIGMDSAGGQDIKIWNGSGSGSINLALGALTYPAVEA